MHAYQQPAPAIQATAPVGVVLVVDDTPENVSLLLTALEEAGYLVLVALDGHAALQSMRTMRPDLVLLDAVMPGIDGFGTCRMIKADPSLVDVPVVFMTALTETEHVVNGFAAGGIDYVTKPTCTDEVLARVSSHVRQSRTLRQMRVALELAEHAVAIADHDGRLLWATASAQQWIRTVSTSGMPGSAKKTHIADHPSVADAEAVDLPASVKAWLDRLSPAAAHGQAEADSVYEVRIGAHALSVRALGRGPSGEWVLMLNTTARPDDPRAAREQRLQQQFRLTSRETEVLLWAATGKTNRDIGEILGMSPRTVNKHLDHVYTKLGVETRTAAAAAVTKAMNTGS